MKTISILLLLVLLVSCSRNEDRVESYAVPKPPIAPVPTGQMQMGQAPGMMPGMMPGQGMPSSNGPSPFSWKTPANWTPGPTSQFRIGSFEIAGPGAEKYAATIIVLGGEGGSLVDNVNRWREQVGLASQNSQQILASAKKDQGSLGAFTWFDIEDKANPKLGMLTAILKSEGNSVFVKLVAPPEILTKNKSKFLELCRSLKKNSNPHAGMTK